MVNSVYLLLLLFQVHPGILTDLGAGPLVGAVSGRFADAKRPTFHKPFNYLSGKRSMASICFDASQAPARL